jgi:hypothetical protein
MERDGGPVTIAGIAARAKVSRTFLYDGAQAPLLERLRAIANTQPSSGRPALPENQRVSTKSHETIVRTLRRQPEAPPGQRPARQRTRRRARAAP